ncbi:hypothetical protein HID58_080917 [Brassica napus]|uniref:Phosphoglycerate mutase family protein n=1 Tax=Brassica napus TaxID=3708 RepID=A0ABQ7Y6C1_BRANA|nr:hypothetical protein HID58_080917 [Brassica napus]
MDARFLYPLESCKIIHLLRHGQAMHNVAAEKDRNALLSPHLFDAPLTDHGHQQVENLRERVVSSGLLKRVELVVTSPLLRTMQTAVGVFGNEDKQQNIPSSPSIVALEVARDRNGVRPPDMRRNVSEYQTLFPTIDFSQANTFFHFSFIESEEDNLWRPDVRESEEEIFARGLWKRPEKEVAVVSHGIVLQHMLYVFANDCDKTITHELCKRFANCELRTVVIVDKGLVRHAQGIHNVVLEEKRGIDEIGDVHLSPKLFDAPLSPKGVQQVSEQHKQILESGLLNTIEAMETAVGIFRGHKDINLSHNFPPIVALELCRERMGLYPCDRRESISTRRICFPEIDFTMVESDEDALWREEERENLEERPEKEIAVVSHGIFLQQTLCALHEKVSIPLEDSLLTRFANCELRSIRIDESDMEAVTVTTYNCIKNVAPPSPSLHTLE